MGPYKLIDAGELKQYPPDSFTVTDRVNNKPYTTQSSAYYSKLMRAYVQALESERSRIP
jgi:hypothetical protein